MQKSRTPKIPTTTSLVVEAMDKADDFLTAATLMTLTGRAANQVTAALHHLRKCGRVASLEEGGHLFWYSTPDSDRRVWQLDEITPERKPRCRRRATVVPLHTTEPPKAL